MFAKIEVFKRLRRSQDNSQKITVLSDPKIGASVIFELHEGTKVKPIESFESFQKIEIANGQSGWIPTSSIRFIKE